MRGSLANQGAGVVGQQPVAVATGKDKMPGLLVVALTLSAIASMIYIVRTLTGK